MQHLPLSVASLRALFTSRVLTQTSVGLQSQLEARPQDGDLSSTSEESDEFKFDLLPTSGNKAELFRFQKQC
jgi:hypothetical protein